MSEPGQHAHPLHRKLWRELRWLVTAWRNTDPPDRWNPIFVRELRRGSWKDGLLPRVALMQAFCCFVWAAAEEGWWTLPIVSSIATVLIEARAAAADHRSDTWELFRVTGHSHRLWWRGWKWLHFSNLLAALSTLLPWAIIVNLTQGAQFGTFCLSVVLCVPASCLAFRRWTAFGFSTTPWKRWTLMGLALLWIESLMMVGWSILGLLTLRRGGEALIMSLALLVPPLIFTFYAECWLQTRLKVQSRELGEVDGRILLLVLGCILCFLTVIHTPLLLFFIVMEVNLSNRSQVRDHRSFYGSGIQPGESGYKEAMRNFRI